MSKLKIRISFTGGKVVSVVDTFVGAVEMVLTNETLKKYHAFKITIQNTGTVLYLDDQAFLQFYQGELTYDELVERTQCDELYRNWLEVEADGDVIEPGALWKQHGQELILIDEDRHITTPLTTEGFEIAT